MKKTCPVLDCRKTFSTQFCLSRHMKCSHLHERPYQCEYCFKSFGYKHVLLHHKAKKHLETDCATLPPQQGVQVAITIPKLTQFTRLSIDPDLGQFVHISRIYLFPVTDEDITLPPIDSERGLKHALPGLRSVRKLKRRKTEARILENDDSCQTRV